MPGERSHGARWRHRAGWPTRTSCQAGATNAPQRPPLEGLRLGTFLSSDDPYANQDRELAAALAKLKADGRFSVLDLEGRTITLYRTFDIDDGDERPFSKPLKIANGTFIPSDKWPDPEQPLVRFFSSSQSRIARWGLEGLKFKCLNRASAVLVNRIGNLRAFRWLDIDDPARFGIRTRLGGMAGGDLRVELLRHHLELGRQAREQARADRPRPRH